MRSVCGKGVVLVALLVTGAGLAGAATNQWKVGGTDTLWTTVNNWTLGTKPASTDRARFKQLTAGMSYSSTLTTTEMVDNVYADIGDMTLSWYGAGSLTVLNDFFWQNSLQQSYFEPRLNVGGRFYTPSWWDGRGRLKFGNASAWTSGNIFGGGIDSYGPGLDLGGATIVSNRVLASGKDVLGWYTDGGSRNMGVVKFNGTATRFGAGMTFDLRRGGTLWFPSSNNFSNVGTLLFQGGMLRLGSAINLFPVYANGFEVPRGSLAIAGNRSLGVTDANGITLGSLGHFGYLVGGAANSDGNRITRPITLAGNGGVLSAMEAFLNSDMNVGTPITGSGALIKNGEKTMWLRNAGVGLASSYSGGTIVANGALALETERTLGSGDVAIRGGGGLYLYAPANLAAGARVLVGGDLYQRGLLVLRTAMTPPVIDTDSTGIIAMDNIIQSAPLSSIGACFLGGYNTSSYSASSLPVGSGNTYRLGGVLDPMCTGAVAAHRVILDVNNGDNGAGVLTGPNDLLVAYGGARLKDLNDFTGAITVRNNMRYDTWDTASLLSDFQTGGSPLGSPTAAVNLYSGMLRFYSPLTGAPIVKGDLNVQGRSHLLIDCSENSYTSVVTFASLNRLNRGHFAIYGYRNKLGDRERVIVTAAPVPVNGIVAPWMISDWSGQTPAFLTYGANGFERAAYGTTVSGGAFPTDGSSVVQVTGATTLGANADIYALRANAAISRGAGTNVTLRSGGLLLTSASTHNCNFTFGAAGDAEGLVYNNVNATLSGNLVTTNGFTKGGPGVLTVSAVNSATLSGKIVVNGGTLHAYRDNSLGASSTRICLNGGAIRHDWDQSISHTISVGPAGGFLGGDWWGFNLYSSIVDDQPGVPGGPLVIRNPMATYANNTFTGPMILMPNVGLTLRWGAAPTKGPVTVMAGARLLDSTTSGTGWENLNRFNLRGGGTAVSALTLAPESGGARTWRIGSIEGSGNISLGGQWGAQDGSTLMVGADNTSCDYHGSMFEYSSNKSHKLIKEGTGTWTLWGVNDHRGATTVKAGELRVNGAVNLSAITVTNGATLSGKGYIGSTVNVRAGCTLAGSLVFANNVTLNPASTLELTLNGPTAVAQYDQITISGGTFNMNNCTVKLTLLSAPPNGQTYRILNNTGGTISGSPLVDGQRVVATFADQTYQFQVDYAPDNITLTALPRGTVIRIR